MAETAKKRKRTKKAFFDDSDDDFSEPTPQLHQVNNRYVPPPSPCV